jgi:hypothetical protein
LMKLGDAGGIGDVMTCCGCRSMLLLLMLCIPCSKQLNVVFETRRCWRIAILDVRRNSIAKVLVERRGVVLGWLQLFSILRRAQRVRSEVAICVRSRLRKVHRGMFCSVVVGRYICLIRTQDAHGVGACGAGVNWGEFHVS